MQQLFIASMKCPVCGVVTRDTSTEMYTMELPSKTDPPLYINVGDTIGVRFEQVAGAGFKIQRQPASKQSFRLLQPWSCPACKTRDQWALIELSASEDAAVLKSITPVPKTRQSMERADAISYAIELDPAFGSG